MSNPYSNIFRIAATKLRPLLLILSLIVLYRGHQQPGGGFIGGLMAASAYILYALAFNSAEARRKLPLSTSALLGTGLAVILVSGLLSVLAGEPFMTGMWTTLHLPFGQELHLGTPVLFDAGVYLAVIGVLLTIMFDIIDIE